MSYGNSFFDTQAGQRFVNYTIPSLVEEIQRMNIPKKQRVEVTNKNPDVVARLIDDLNESGWNLVHTLDCDSRVVLVFEKTS